MRPYKPKHNVQKKAFYSDRFSIAKELPKESTQESLFSSDIERLKSRFEIIDSYIQLGQLVVYINPRDIKAVVEFFKIELSYDILTEMSAIDWLESQGEFELFYQMLSISEKKRARVKAYVKEGVSVDSVEPIFRSADWAERECFDMFGIKFNNHPYLKRILMPDDWQGYPLRKSYPLEGDEFAKWYEVDKIFGKENREIIGEENRDTAMVDRYDSERFARLGYEVPRGAEVKSSETDIKYQEDEGVLMIDKLNPEKSKLLKERR